MKHHGRFRCVPLASRRWLAVWSCVLGLAPASSGIANEPAPAPLPPAQAAAAMTVPEGFQVTLFAGEPDVVQPIAMTFDARGRLWVVECLSYPKWTNDGTGHDRVSILEDTDGDGRHDRKTMFLDNGVNLSGIEVGWGGVWLTSVPQLVFVPDRNGDDRPDGPPQVMLDGWDLNARHNVVNGLGWGPDGWLYGCNGILSQAKVGPPGSSDEQRVTMNCGVWRYHPQEKRCEAVGHGSTNPWGLDWDDYGQMFITNCVIKHIFHVVPGGHYDRMFGQDVNPYVYGLLPSCADHIHWAGGPWESSRTGTGAHSDAGGGHAHSGCAVYLGGQFPPEYRNSVFMCNIHGNRLNRDLLEVHDATYVAKHAPDFLMAHDSWFRGIAVKCGPEGGLYFSDWTDTGECHNYEVADTSNGRIYRVTYGSVKGPHLNLEAMSDLDLVQRQFDTNEFMVRQSRRLLSERVAADPSRRDRVAAAVGQLTPHTLPQQLRKLWALSAVQGRVALPPHADDDSATSPWLIAAAVDLLATSPASKWSAAERAWVDELAQHLASPVVYRAVLSLCERQGQHGEVAAIAPLLLTALETESHAQDPFLTQLAWYAAEPAVSRLPDEFVGRLPHIALALVRESLGRRLTSLNGGLDRLLQAWKQLPDGPWQADTLRGVLLAFEGLQRLDEPTAWPAAFDRLQRSSIPNVANQARWLATLYGNREVLADLHAIAADMAASPVERSEALSILLARKAPGLLPLLTTLAASPSELRSAAIRGLLADGSPTVPPLLFNLYAQLSSDDKNLVVYGLTSRATDALALLDAIERGAIPREDISALVVRQMQLLKHPQLQQRLEGVWGTIRPASQLKQEMAHKYREELTPAALSQASLERGRQLYAKTCGNCHKLFGAGGGIGPELTGSQRVNLDYLLENVLDPSAIVPFDYRVTLLQLDDGRIQQGIVVQDTDNSLVLQTVTDRVIVPKSAIEEQTRSAVSMMPEGLMERLTAEERRDLIAYLQSDGRVTAGGF
jgi:putative membrane-bound dehydrogenase-like protein